MFRLFLFLKHLVFFRFHPLPERFLDGIQPSTTFLLLGTLTDRAGGESELLAENVLLRHQLITLRRQTKRPVDRKTDRFLLVFLARMVRTWKHALFLVQPETLLRWHRELFRWFWKRTAKCRSKKRRLSPETIAFITDMAAHNRRWGAERICGELLTLGIHVGKRTIQKSMRNTRTPRKKGQTWATFLRTQAACAGYLWYPSAK